MAVNVVVGSVGDQCKSVWRGWMEREKPNTSSYSLSQGQRGSCVTPWSHWLCALNSEVLQTSLHWHPANSFLFHSSTYIWFTWHRLVLFQGLHQIHFTEGYMSFFKASHWNLDDIKSRNYYLYIKTHVSYQVKSLEQQDLCASLTMFEPLEPSRFPPVTFLLSLSLIPKLLT